MGDDDSPHQYVSSNRSKKRFQRRRELSKCPKCTGHIGSKQKIQEKVKWQKSSTIVSQRTAAIAAGISIVLMAVVAGFSFGFVLDSLVVSGDAAATAANILASETLFRVGVFGWIVILILDVIVAWALYVVLKRANKSLSLLAAWFRLVYAALLGVSLLSFVIVLLLISGADYLKVFEADQLQALVLLFINAFDGMWRIGIGGFRMSPPIAWLLGLPIGLHSQSHRLLADHCLLGVPNR